MREIAETLEALGHIGRAWFRNLIACGLSPENAEDGDHIQDLHNKSYVKWGNKIAYWAALSKSVQMNFHSQLFSLKYEILR